MNNEGMDVIMKHTFGYILLYLSLSLRLFFPLIFLFLFFSIPRFSYYHFLSAFPSACLFCFSPTPIFYLLFLSRFLLSYTSCHFRPYILISILFSFPCDSYFYSSCLSRSCFTLSILHLFLLQLILNPDFSICVTSHCVMIIQHTNSVSIKTQLYLYNRVCLTTGAACCSFYFVFCYM